LFPTEGINSKFNFSHVIFFVKDSLKIKSSLLASIIYMNVHYVNHITCDASPYLYLSMDLKSCIIVYQVGYKSHISIIAIYYFTYLALRLFNFVIL